MQDFATLGASLNEDGTENIRKIKREKNYLDMKWIINIQGGEKYEC